MAPLQRLMNCDVKLLIDKNGHILKVFGMERLDEEMRRDISFSLLEGMEMLTHPLKVGDEFVRRRNFISSLPKDLASMFKGKDECEVEVKRVLEAIERDSNGGKVAKLKGKMEKKFTDLPLDVNGNHGDLILDFDYISWFDVTHGCVRREIAKGKSIVDPKGLSPVVVQTSLEISLME